MVWFNADAELTRRIADGFAFVATTRFLLISGMALAYAFVRAFCVDALHAALGDAYQFRVRIFLQLESFVAAHNVRRNTCRVQGIHIA